MQSLDCLFTLVISIIKLNNYIENNLGGFISFNNFLSTNKNKEISLDFARYTLSNADIVSVLFIITVNPSKSTSSFATIDKAAYLGGEDEIIFVMHTIFRIQKIQPIDENSRLFQVELELTHKNDEEVKKAPIYHQLGLLKDDQEEYKESIEFYEKALEILQQSLSPNYSNLCMTYNNMGAVFEGRKKMQWAHLEGNSIFLL